MPRNDVAIYAPFAGGIYDLARRRAGGAERQTVLLARSLAARGVRVGHIVYPMAEPPPAQPGLELVPRGIYEYSARGRALEPAMLWRAMARADAATYVFRGASAAVGIAAAFCRLRRRRLVYAGANNSDFTLENIGGANARLYRAGVRAADAVVVQSSDQAELAAAAFPDLRRVIEIPSFVEEAPVAAPPPDAFLWVARISRFKRPLEYVELARAVPEARFRMIATPVLGDTTPELLAALERARAEVPNLELLEPRPHAEVLALLERAVAVVNTSTTEGMPNTFLEAWARGIPALSLEFDADGRIATHGLGVVAGGDRERLAAAARRLWARRDRREEFADATRRYIRATHGAEAVGGRWAALFSELR